VKLTHGENVVFVEIHDSKITNFASVSMAAGSKQGAEHDESKPCRAIMHISQNTQEFVKWGFVIPRKSEFSRNSMCKIPRKSD
jgi:hypothetical protein